MPENYKLIFIQPTLTHYRLPFFKRLADCPNIEVRVYFSSINFGPPSRKRNLPDWAHNMKAAQTLPLGFTWGSEGHSIPIKLGEVLVVGGNPRSLSTLILVIRARLRGAHVIWWGHYWSATSKSWGLYIRLKMMRLAHALIFYVDEEIAEYQRFTGGHDTRLITALNNGIELKDIREFRAQYNDLVNRPRDLVFIGRITRKSELKLAIDALAQPRCSYVTLDVIGDGADSLDLRQYANNVGVGDRIRWHGAMTEERYIGRIMNECKAFVYPGSVGLSLIHALSYGLPCIVHNDRWKHMPEIAALCPGQNGVTFERGDVISLAEGVENLLSDPDELRRMSINARETTENRFNIEGMTERFSSVLEAISKVE